MAAIISMALSDSLIDTISRTQRPLLDRKACCKVGQVRVSLTVGDLFNHFVVVSRCMFLFTLRRDKINANL